MKLHQLSLLAACASLCCGAFAADYVDNAIGVGVGSGFSNPGTNDGDVRRLLLDFSHFSVDKSGTNTFYTLLLRSGANEPAVGGGGGAQEVYSFYSRDWSLGKLAGASFGSWVRDVSVTTRLDYATKNDAFGERMLAVSVGPTVSFNVPGYLNVGLYAYKESNHNGIVGQAVHFDVAPRLGASWGIPVGAVWTFKGFLSQTGAKGTDGFRQKTKPETLLQAKLMADTGALFGTQKNGVLLGVGFEYWRNKFGADPAVTRTGTTRQLAPMLVLESHF